jgi:transcriptional regulator with XRE-family HTH domain
VFVQEKEIHPIDIYAGQRLREARKAVGLSQDTLGNQLEHPITFQQIQKYERGSNRLAASKLWEFAKALQVPPEFFFPPFDEQVLHCENVKEAKLLNAFRHMSSEKQSALLVLLQTEDS